MNTGERIKQARLAAGMTQKELADKVGVKFSAIHKYEAGMVVNLKRETIAALSAALDVRPSWLMCMDDELEESKEPATDGDGLSDVKRKLHAEINDLSEEAAQALLTLLETASQDR